MSSSRDYPFTFSPNLRDSLGTPDRLNTEIRTAFPSLFDNSIKSRLTYVNDDLLGPGVMMRHSPQPPLPAGTPVGLFAGHVTLDWHRRDITTLPLPTFPIHGVEVRLSIHASALMRRSPSPITAALFNHHCNEPTLHSTWWLDGQIPCLIALTSRDLYPGDRLSWNFNLHDPTAPYAMTLPQSHIFRRASGIRVHRCTCSMPNDCPSHRMIPAAAPWPSREDS